MNLTESEMAVLADPPEGRVPETHAHKPDEHDPWRYVCPECKSQVHQHRQSFSFQCGGCRRTWAYEKLWDKKYGMTIEERRATD